MSTIHEEGRELVAGILADDDWNHVIGPDHRHGGIGEPGILFLFEQVLKNT